MSKDRKIQLMLFGVIIALIILMIRSCDSRREYESLYEAANDSLRISINKNGEQEARIKVMAASSKKALIDIHTKDTTIIWLQNIVKDYKGKLDFAMVLSNETRSAGGSVTLINKTDTIYKDSMIYLFPQYKSEWDSKWESGSILATKDSIFREIRFKNEFEILQGKEKNGWFKKREFEIMVRNMNPNTYTTELRSFKIQARPKRFTFGVQFGYGFGFINLKPDLFLGIGINYTIFSIK